MAFYPATAIAILTCAWITATGLLLGSAIAQRTARHLSPSGRALLGLAVGLPILAYLTLALGLLGRLRQTDLLVMLLAADAVGLVLGWRVVGDLGAAARKIWHAVRHSRQRALYWVLALWVVTLLPLALAIPAGEDWDGVAEHLAMAKVWLTQGAITPLWYEHHAQFPATQQMLYILGLNWGGPVGAKLLHFLMALLTVGATGWLARRHFGRGSGPVAMLIVAATPLVNWLATIAYVDLGAVLYLVLGMSLYLDWLGPRREGANLATAAAVWAGVMLGVAMAMKMQSLLYFSVLAAGAVLAWWRRRKRRGTPLGQVVAFVAVAVVVCSPWYLKSWVWTGNPVYPFAYSVFGGKAWSEWQAQRYTYEQKSWGWGELPPLEEYWELPPLQRAFAGPHRPDRLLLAPLGMTFAPWYYTDKGVGEAAILQCIGPLYLAFLPLLLLIRQRPWAWRVVGWAVVPAWLWILWSALYVRYFLPGFIWLTAPMAWAVRSVGGGPWGRRATGTALAVLLVFCMGLNLWMGKRTLPLWRGQVTIEEYLSAMLPPYQTCAWLNQAMTPQDKVIVYGEPRLFYLDRPYLWGDPAYHRLLVYDRMTTADDLIAGYRGLGITYVMVNLTTFPGNQRVDQRVKWLLMQAISAGRLSLAPRAWTYQSYVVFRVTPGEAQGDR